MPKIQMRRDTAKNWTTNNPTLLSGEWALETDTRRMKIGDGTTPYNTLPYSTADDSEEWEKPAEWVDIRSGALDNSIYFLVGHAVDYSKYPEFSVNATITNSGNYDVYVDGVKQATTASATDTVLNWQTLALHTGWDVTYPETLRTHIVRVTPSVSTNRINAIRMKSNSSKEQGLLWAHLNITNTISITRFFGTEAAPYYYCYLLEAVTAIQNKINLNERGFAFKDCENLQKVPTLNGINAQNFTGMFNNCKKIKRVDLTGMWGIYAARTFKDCHNLEEIISSTMLSFDWGELENCYKLKNFPFIIKQSAGFTNYTFANCKNLNPLFIDKTNFVNSGGYLKLCGSSSSQLNLIGLVVNPADVYNSNASDPINVSYTNMNRGAIVALFNSMPTLTETRVCNITGTIGAADLTAEDIAIAVNKGWTITR